MNASGPRTVLFVSWAPFFSGAERALLILVEHLDQSRYRPVVVLGTRGDLMTELEARGIETALVPIAYTGLRTGPAWVRSVAGIRRVARTARAAIVHSNDVPSFQPAGYAAKWLGLPAVTHVRFPDSGDGFRWFLKPGFRHALFVSGALRSAAIEEAPDLFDGDRSEAVHDGVRLPDDTRDADRLAIRDELGLPRDATVIAFTGQVSEIKGIWEYLDAARQLIQRGLPAEFVVLGDDLKGKGETRRKAARYVAEAGLSEHVRFLGFRPDAPRLIPAFDIIAVPSHVEPLGNATLEAMAAGRPVVGAEVGGIPEMIVHDETGCLVPTKNAARLADALERLVRDPELARRFGRAGRARADRCFSVRAHVERVQGVYDRILGP